MIYPLFAKTHLLLQLYNAHSLCSANSSSKAQQLLLLCCVGKLWYTPLHIFFFLPFFNPYCFCFSFFPALFPNSAFLPLCFTGSRTAESRANALAKSTASTAQ